MPPKDIQRPFIDISENYVNYSVDDFVVPRHYRDDVEAIMLPHGVILNRIEKIAFDILKDAKSNSLVLVCILKGGHQFFSDLVNAIKRLNVGRQDSMQLCLEFMRAKSYQNEASSGNVEISGVDGEALRGKDIIIVEDIIDTGRTISELLNCLSSYKPLSIKVASLLVKKTEKGNKYMPDYAGFYIPDQFVVGYCLDYNEYFRDLDHLCVISDNGRTKYAV